MSGNNLYKIQPRNKDQAQLPKELTPSLNHYHLKISLTLLQATIILSFRGSKPQEEIIQIQARVFQEINFRQLKGHKSLKIKMNFQTNMTYNQFFLSQSSNNHKCILSKRKKEIFTRMIRKMLAICLIKNRVYSAIKNSL